MFRRIFWLSTVAGVGYVGYTFWRWVRQQNQPSAYLNDALAGRLYETQPNRGSTPNASTNAAPVADAPTRRIVTRVHKGAPPSTPVAPAEPPAPEAPASEPAEPPASDISSFENEGGATPEPPVSDEPSFGNEGGEPAEPPASDISSFENEGGATPEPPVSDEPSFGNEGAETPEQPETPMVSAEAEADTSHRSGLTNINTADEDSLVALPGIGRALARRIIAYRNQHGPFATIEALEVIQGIGPRNIDDFRKIVTV